MNKKLVFVPLLFTTFSLVSGTIGINNSKILNSKIVNQAKNEIHVKNYSDWTNLEGSFNNETEKIVIDEDIDFKDSDANSSISLNGSNSVYWLNVEIDGQGHRLYNKPKEYAFTPLFTYGSFNQGIYFHNFVLDGVGTVFDGIGEESSSHDFGDGSKATTSNSPYFQNIIIENNDITDSSHNLDSGQSEKQYSLSLFINNVFLLEAGSWFADNAITFDGIIIRNNHINNNDISFNKAENIKDNIAFSYLSTIIYSVCGTSTHEHNGFVKERNIQIENNTFINN